MKTINEAAKDFESTNGERIWSENENSGQILCIESFKSGVEFAQRWIPVEEELPEDNFMECGIQFGMRLLIKCPNEMIYIGNRTFSEDHDKFIWRYSDGGRIYDVVSWRPIELL